MCGRFVGNFSTARLLSEVGEGIRVFGLEFNDETGVSTYTDHPNFNLAPTQIAPVLVREGDAVRLSAMTWGLVPRWAKDSSRASSMINARSESVSEKPSFRGLLSGHRCIVPMNGFYEWDRTDPRNRIPHFCERVDGKLLLAAGLWTTSPVVPDFPTFCILTRASGADLEFLHDRCPVHFTAEDAGRWLADPSAPLELTGAENQPELTVRRVNKRVNSVRNNGPDLLRDEPDSNGESSSSNSPTLF